MRNAGLIVTALLLLIVAGCGGNGKESDEPSTSPPPSASDGTTSPVTGVNLNKLSIEILVGELHSLVAAVEPSDATNRSISWASANDVVASVSSSGIVTGESPGSTIITVMTAEGGFTDSCTVTVPPVSVAGVTLSQPSMTMLETLSRELAATIQPSNATNQGVVWSSAASGIASVSSSGVVTGEGLGETTITVTTEDGGFTADCSVTVKPYFVRIGQPYTAVDGLTVTLTSLTVSEKPGSYQYLIAYTLTNNTPDQAIDEGSFKMYYAEAAGGLPEYGFFDKLFLGDTKSRSYVFEDLKTMTFDVLEYHHDNFFTVEPLEDSLRWRVEIP